MEALSVKHLIDKNIVRRISSLQLETYGAYFLIFYDSKGKSAKLYFTQKGNVFLSQKFYGGDDISELLKDSDIIQVSFKNTKYKFEIYLSTVRDYSSQATISEIFEIDNLSRKILI